MRRHVLLYRGQRQYGFARRKAARQPLLVRATKQQPLVKALGLTAAAPQQEISIQQYARVSAQHNAPRFNSVRPLSARDSAQHRAANFNPARSVSQSSTAQSASILRPQVEMTSIPTPESIETGSPIPFSSIPETVESTADQQVTFDEVDGEPLDVQDQEPVQVEHPLELPMAEPFEIAGVQNPPAEEPLTESTVESTPAPQARQVQLEEPGQPLQLHVPVQPALQQKQERANTNSPLLVQGKVKRTRGRIEERPVQLRQAPDSPPAPSSSRVRRGEQTKAAPETPAVKEEEELFAPQGTDRSPQAWLARLNRAAGAQREEMAQPAAQTAIEAGSQTGRRLLYGTPLQAQRVLDMEPLANSGSRMKAAPPARTPTSVHEVSQDTVRSCDQHARQVEPVPTPLSERARRFLQPLVGIDPVSIRVHRDAIAERQAGFYQADAITIGEDVAIAAGHPEDTPETLGLLAHEFTHIARQREPHFIPPVARVESSSPANALPVSSDEEALALHVESQVMRSVRQQVNQVSLTSEETPAPYSAARYNPSRPAPVYRPVASVEPPVESTDTAPASTSGRDTWGGLPAPWEPLPDWLVSTPATMEDNGYTSAISPSLTQIAYVPAQMVGSTGGEVPDSSMPGETGVQRAGVERSIGEDKAQQQPSASVAQAPPPDLDVLARQVYAHLKRRLQAERRRES